MGAKPQRVKRRCTSVFVLEKHVGIHAACVGRRRWHEMMPEVVIAWSLRSLGASKRAVSASISGVRNGITRVDHGYVVHDREVLCDDVDVHGHLVAVRVLLDVQLLVQRRSVLTQRRSLMSLDWSVHGKCRDDGRYAIRCTRSMAVKVI